MNIGTGPDKQNMKDHILLPLQGFPAENPKYSCIVVINDFIDTTDLNHYGGDIAAPVFREISDKVFAFDSEMEYLSNININSENKIERVSLQRLTIHEENIKIIFRRL